MSVPTRRAFAQSVVAGLAPALAGPAKAAGAGAEASRESFPASFLWGCATAAYQVEGAVKEDGRGPSVWDTFSHTPGRVENGDTGDVATDSYHRYKEDIQLLKWLGAKAYRFSVAWPRVFPQGAGQPNEKGMAYYDRLVDELLAQGIEPWATLYHWDLPQALEDSLGGWESRDTAKRFADYAAYVTRRLSDRVTNFFTTNEVVCFIDLSYGRGAHAPGKKLPPGRLNQARHHGLLAHGLGLAAVRANARKPVKVGVAENPSLCTPILDTPEHIAAARKAMRELNAPYLTVMLEGRYADSFLARAGKDAPRFTAEDMKLIGGRLDFVGLNCYTPVYIKASGRPEGFERVENAASHPRMNVDWLYLDPRILYWTPRFVHELWKPKALYITENGCPSADKTAADGKIYDTDRVLYLRHHLSQVQRAIADGVPLRGYFCWSLLDNFEWAYGYSKRFGLFHVDFQTQKRTAKLSAEFYRDAIQRNSVA